MDKKEFISHLTLLSYSITSPTTRSVSFAWDGKVQQLWLKFRDVDSVYSKQFWDIVEVEITPDFDSWAHQNDFGSGLAVAEAIIEAWD